MKKFIGGVICGIVLSISMTSFATNEVIACLFPSKIMIHIGDTVKEINAGGDPIINYNNRVYIPLKSFSNAMGSYVTYQAPSASTENLNKIDVYVVGEKDFPIQDPDGYVSLNIINIKSTNDPSNAKEVSGLIRINKNMNDKFIEIIPIDNTGKEMSTIAFPVIIDDELFQGLNIGNIRTFSVEMNYEGEPSSYKIKLSDRNTIGSFYGAVGYGSTDPTGFFFGGIDSTKTLSISKDRWMDNFSLSVINHLEKNITFKPLNVEYQIVQVKDGKDNLIGTYNVSIPEIIIPGRSMYGIDIPVWNFKDKNGNTISAGKYAAQIKLPTYFEYYIEGSNEVIRQTASEYVNCRRFEFNVDQ